MEEQSGAKGETKQSNIATFVVEVENRVVRRAGEVIDLTRRKKYELPYLFLKIIYKVHVKCG